MEIVFLTGLSGAGKSQAANLLEDWGYACVDNIPLSLIAPLAETYRTSPAFGGKLAVVTDIRCAGVLDDLLPLIGALREGGDVCTLIFLDCRDETVIHRYKFTRRLHPLSQRDGIAITEALARERALLAPVRAQADVLIDTSDISVTTLKGILEEALGRRARQGLLVLCMSFGFKYGIPPDADTVLDVRCFPNPYHVPALRPLTGLDAPVRAYVFDSPDTVRYMETLRAYFAEMLPLYEKEGRKQFTIAVGCTGGQHRSVAIAQALSESLSADGYRAVVIHRDVAGGRREAL